MTADEANAMSGKDPDFATRDLYNAIAEGDFPKWYFCSYYSAKLGYQKEIWVEFFIYKCWHAVWQFGFNQELSV
jgi:catalase